MVDERRDRTVEDVAHQLHDGQRRLDLHRRVEPCRVVSCQTVPNRVVGDRRSAINGGGGVSCVTSCRWGRNARAGRCKPAAPARSATPTVGHTARGLMRAAAARNGPPTAGTGGMGKPAHTPRAVFERTVPRALVSFSDRVRGCSPFFFGETSARAKPAHAREPMSRAGAARARGSDSLSRTGFRARGGECELA